ncbi:Cu(+)/Ag(+) sensor histidine kinase [Morganella psychrotolerans]|uniref:Sensor protein n=1 Tax=Morganella psychrotolerans TaxID=368603 RepID=A0A1B8HTL3_9GAMM|nr:Cu(+)/Ag(+) sensor histidine kinase [Morganella psychrotolerans]OBU13223.1 two-component sensor histidine kinase [Morganella psychrotolerans]
MTKNSPRRPFSLATRLTFFISLATVTAFVAFTWIMLHSVEKHFAQQDDSDLRQISATIHSILQDNSESESQRLSTLNSVLNNYPNIAAVLLDKNNKVLFQSQNGPDFNTIINSPAFSQKSYDDRVFRWEKENDPTAYRILITPAGAHYTLLISLSINFHLHYIDELKRNLMMTASAISLLIVIIVLFAVYTGHQPLRSVSDKIKNITSEDLTVRLDPENVPIELAQLVISFNHMLGRIEDVFTRQANFSADIAHEIRTPITNLLTQTEIALSQPRTTKELEDILDSGMEEYHRLAKMVTDMLFLAQADNNQLIPEQSLLNLHTEAMKVIDYYDIVAEEQGISLMLTGEPAYINGDSVMIRRVINNLLSNAVRYTPPEGTIIIAIKQENNLITLMVKNPGTPIAAQHLPRLFDRLYRVDPARRRNGEGSGIGLAIVKSIVTAHHGRIQAESDEDSTRFIISFPVIHG